MQVVPPMGTIPDRKFAVGEELRQERRLPADAAKTRFGGTPLGKLAWPPVVNRPVRLDEASLLANNLPRAAARGFLKAEVLDRAVSDAVLVRRQHVSGEYGCNGCCTCGCEKNSEDDSVDRPAASLHAPHDSNPRLEPL